MSKPEQLTPDLERGDGAVVTATEISPPDEPKIGSNDPEGVPPSGIGNEPADSGGDSSASYEDTEDDHSDDSNEYAASSSDSDISSQSKTASIKGHESRKAYRKERLAAVKNTQDSSKLKQLKEPVRMQRLLHLAERLQSKQQFEFFRFERLALLNLLYQQHKLIEYDEHLRACKNFEEKSWWYKVYENKVDIKRLGSTLQAYCKYLRRGYESWFLASNGRHLPGKCKLKNSGKIGDAVQNFQTLSKHKQPDLKPSRRLGRRLAKQLNEPR